MPLILGRLFLFPFLYIVGKFNIMLLSFSKLKNIKVTFLDEIFFSFFSKRSFNPEHHILEQYLVEFPDEYNKKIPKLSHLKDRNIARFIEAVIYRFESRSLIEKLEDGKYIKGRNYQLAFDVGGYTAYCNYLRQQIEFPNHQRTINKLLVLTAFLSIVAPILTMLLNNWLYKQPPIVVNVPDQSVQHTVVSLDSLSLSQIEQLMQHDSIQGIRITK